MSKEAVAKQPPLPTDWRRLHALGLPGGSVRAVLALAIVGSISALLYLQAEGQGVPYYLQNLMFIILGHYFAARHRYDPAGTAGPPPLWLPRGSVRVLLVAFFVLVAVVLSREGRLSVAAPNQAMWTLLLVAAFLFGVVLSHALAWWNRRGLPAPRWIEDVRSLLSLAAAAALVVYLFEPWIGAKLGALGGFADLIERHRGGEILASVVGFYYGSRS